MNFFIDPLYNTRTLEFVIPPELQWLRDNHKEFTDYLWFRNKSNVHAKVEIQILKPDIAIVFALKFGKSAALT